VVELDLVIGRESHSLRDRLGAASSDGARVEAFQDWLIERRRVHDGFEVVDRALVMLRRYGSRAPVTTVCKNLGISNKHLIEQFRRLVGLPPKIMGRIARFQQVVDTCRGQQAIDWPDLAYASGYADQSHLIREFRRLAGVTPSDFLVQTVADELRVPELDR